MESFANYIDLLTKQMHLRFDLCAFAFSFMKASLRICCLLSGIKFRPALRKMKEQKSIYKLRSRLLTGFGFQDGDKFFM